MDQNDNAQEQRHTNKPSQSSYYEISVRGQLDSNWSDWFNGLDVRPQENGETLITGPVQDQAALQGILTKIFNLRLLLNSVKRIQYLDAGTGVDTSFPDTPPNTPFDH